MKRENKNKVHHRRSWQLSSLITKKSCEDYKRTWQGVPNVLLSYLYYSVIRRKCGQNLVRLGLGQK